MKFRSFSGLTFVMPLMTGPDMLLVSFQYYFFEVLYFSIMNTISAL